MMENSFFSLRGRVQLGHWIDDYSQAWKVHAILIIGAMIIAWDFWEYRQVKALI